MKRAENLHISPDRRADEQRAQVSVTMGQSRAYPAFLTGELWLAVTVDRKSVGKAVFSWHNCVIET